MKNARGLAAALFAATVLCTVVGVATSTEPLLLLAVLLFLGAAVAGVVALVAKPAQP